MRAVLSHLDSKLRDYEMTWGFHDLSAPEEWAKKVSDSVAKQKVRALLGVIVHQ